MRAPSQEPVKPPAQLPPMKIGSVDVEVFSRNLARLVEEGGRALAAYLKPREEGRDDSEFADEVDRSRQDARPGRGILAGRPAAHRRTAEPARQGLSRSMGVRGETACRRGSPSGGAPGTERQALHRSGMDAKPVLRFPQAGLSAHRGLGRHFGAATPPTSIRTPGRRPNSMCGRSPMRCRRPISS